MEVHGGNSVPKCMIEYMKECHPYVRKAVFHTRTVSSKNKRLQGMRRTFGKAYIDERTIYINVGIHYFNMSGYGPSTYSTHWSRPMTDVWLNLWSTIIHECRHIWQFKTGFIDERSGVPYYRRREEKDARDFSKREFARLATRDKHVFWEPTGYFAKQYYDSKRRMFNNSTQSSLYRIMVVRLEKYKNKADVPITAIAVRDAKALKALKDAIYAGQLGFWNRDSRGHRHCYLTMAEWVKFVRINHERSEIL